MSRTTNLTRHLLSDLHAYWYKSCTRSNDAPLAPEVFKSWFMQSDDTDRFCREQYLPALNDAAGMTVDEIRGVAGGSADEELAAVILLDQIPRNVFRGMDAAKAYTVYDPKARDLARKLLEEGYSARSKFPSFAHTMFLFMPFMHSESLADHDFGWKYLQARGNECVGEGEKQGLENVSSFELKHRKVLEQFGRYPSRNEALGRENTEEEKKHLADGPGW